MKTMMLIVGLALAGCSSNSSSNTPQDSSLPADAGTADASCFDLSGVANPTHDQIINACTTADKIFKDSKPPLLNADGSLPPLPQ
jgi:hypothetical protein